MGDGQWKGGLGQDMEIGTTGDEPFLLFASFDRIDYPARGRMDGQPGAPGELEIAGGRKLAGKGKHVIAPGERLVVRTPGGGGYGAA